MPFDLASAKPYDPRLDLQDELSRAADEATGKPGGPPGSPKVKALQAKLESLPSPSRDITGAPKRSFDLASAKPVAAPQPKEKPQADPNDGPLHMLRPTNLLGAAVEPLLSMGTGAIGSVAGGLTGLADLATGGKKSGDTSRAVQSALTYQPRTQGGKDAMTVLGYPFQKLGEAADVAGEKTTDVAGPAAGAAVNTLINFAPQLLGSKGARVAAEKGPSFLPEMAPKMAPEAQLLREHGIQPTWGQMLGGGWNTTEQALSKWPIVGAPIRGARNRAREEFNLAPLKDSLAEIGKELPANTKPGWDAVRETYRQFREEYADVQSAGIGRLDGAGEAPGTSLVPRGDALGARQPGGLRKDLTDLLGMLPESNMGRKYQSELNRIVKAEVLDRFKEGGVASGETIKAMQNNLRELADTKRRSEKWDVRKQAEFLDEVQHSIDTMMARENPQLAERLAAVDRGYAKFKIVQRAAASPGAKEGVFTPNQFLQAIRAKDATKDKRAYSEGGALMQEFGGAAQKMLGDTLPDSGTPTQALVAALLESATGHGKGWGLLGIPGGAAGMAALSIPYSRPMLSLGERMLMNPPTSGAPLASVMPFGINDNNR